MKTSRWPGGPLGLTRMTMPLSCSAFPPCPRLADLEGEVARHSSRRAYPPRARRSGYWSRVRSAISLRSRRCPPLRGRKSVYCQTRWSWSRGFFGRQGAIHCATAVPAASNSSKRIDPAQRPHRLDADLVAQLVAVVALHWEMLPQLLSHRSTAFDDAIRVPSSDEVQADHLEHIIPEVLPDMRIDARIADHRHTRSATLTYRRARHSGPVCGACPVHRRRMRRGQAGHLRIGPPGARGSHPVWRSAAAMAARDALQFLLGEEGLGAQVGHSNLMSGAFSVPSAAWKKPSSAGSRTSPAKRLPGKVTIMPL